MTGQTLAGAFPPQVGDAILALKPDSYWKLDEGTGLYVDSGSAGISANYVSGTRARKGYRSGRAGDIAADTALATWGDNYRFTGRLPCTVLCLHYPTVTTAAALKIVVKGNSTQTVGWQLFYNSANIPGFFRLEGGNVAADYTFTVNDWNLNIGGYDGANNFIYHNGLYKLGAADSVSITGTVDVGRINGVTGDGAGQAARGRYGPTAIWSRALNQGEMDSIWAAL